MNQGDLPDRYVIHGLTVAGREQVVKLLSRMFMHDPLMAYVMEDLDPGEKRAQGIASLMDFSLMIREELMWPILGLFEDGSLAGIAALSLTEKANWQQSLQQRQETLYTSIGSRGAARLEAYGAIVEHHCP